MGNIKSDFSGIMEELKRIQKQVSEMVAPGTAREKIRGCANEVVFDLGEQIKRLTEIKERINQNYKEKVSGVWGDPD